MTKKILITGAGSGLGEEAAIGITRNGPKVIAAAQMWQQVPTLLAKADIKHFLSKAYDSQRVSQGAALSPAFASMARHDAKAGAKS